MSPVEAEPSNVAGTPASTWWWPTAFATGGFTFGGGCVEKRTTSGAARKFPGSLSSFALTANVAAYDVLDAKGLWSTSRTSPPRLLTLQSNVRPPGSGARENAATNEAGATRSVGSTRPREITCGKPPAPPSSEYERVTVRVASSESVVIHRMSWTLPPVQSSPPSGARG